MAERWGGDPEVVRNTYSPNNLQGIKLDYALARCIESSFDVVYLDFGPSLSLDSIRVELEGAAESWSPGTDKVQALRYLKLDGSEMGATDYLERLREIVKETYPEGLDLISLQSPAD